MGAPTEVYVDPSIAGDSGAGTIGDPYGDLQYALNQVTRDATNGDRFNIKAGTDEILSSGLDLSTYGTPSTAAPLIFQGYTSAADDGGQGSVDCNGNQFFSATSNDAVVWIDLEIFDASSNNYIIQVDDFCSLIRCEIHGGGAVGAIIMNTRGMVVGCNIYDCATAISTSNGGLLVADNYIVPTNTGINLNAAFEAQITRNIISCSGNANGIANIAGDGSKYIANNSILASASTGVGISMNTSGALNAVIVGNLIEGFSGTGGIGVEVGSTDETIIVANNGAYNCATNYTLDGVILRAIGDNESLGASPFAKSGSDTFANRFTYFAPVDTGNVIGGAFVG